MMSGRSRGHMGWGVGAVALIGVGLALASLPKSADRSSNGQKFLATKQGRIEELIFKEGSIVDRGVDLVMLDDDTAQEQLRVAQENLTKVMAGARGSDVAVALPGPPAGLGGRIVQTGPLNPPTPSGNFPPPGKPDKNVKPLPGVSGAGDAVGELTPKPNTEELNKLRKEAEQEIEDAKAEEEFCNRELANAGMELEEAQRARDTSVSLTERAKKDVEDSRRLLFEGVISQNSFAQKEGQARMQQSLLDNATKRVEEAKGKIEQLTDALDKAKKRKAEAEIALASAPEKATPKVGTVTRDPIARPLPSRAISQKPAMIVPSNPEGSTAPAKVEIDQSAKLETDAQVSEAKTKLMEAEQAVLDRRITAPRRMKIVKWLVRPTDQVKAGQAIAIIEFLPEAKAEPEKTVTPVAPTEVKDKPKNPIDDDPLKGLIKPGG